jgi:hypothetical protein
VLLIGLAISPRPDTSKAGRRFAVQALKLAAVEYLDTASAQTMARPPGRGDVEMMTIIWIILADIVLLLLFIFFYRQELGLTLKEDKPAVRKKSPASKTTGAAEDQPKGRQVVPSEGTAKRDTQRRPRSI